jgi:hypothetical protein
LYDLGLLATRREWVRAWKPAVPGIHEVFHARFLDHVYPPHTHEAWTVFIVDEGAIRYDLETRHRGAAGARVTILPPYVVHDGRPATSSGFRKRVLYLGSDVLDEDLIGRAVDDPDIEDRTLVRQLGSLHGMLGDPDADLAAETALADVRSRIRAHLGARPETLVDRPGDVASDLRDLLDGHLADRITLAEGRTHPPRVARAPRAVFLPHVRDRPAPLPARPSDRRRAAPTPRGRARGRGRHRRGLP